MEGGVKMRSKITSITLFALLITAILPIEVGNYEDINPIDIPESQSSKNCEPCSIALGQSPIADAGPDQTANVGEIVQLDGSGSYDPDGEFTFSSNIKINDDCLTDVGQYNPSITVDKIDNIHVVWGDRRNDISYGCDIYYSKSNNSGNSFMTNVRVNEDFTDADQGGPVIATNEELDVFVAWDDYRDYTAGDRPAGVYFARSLDYGHTFVPSIKVNDIPGARSIFTDGLAIVTYKNDTIYLAWEDTRNWGRTGLDMYFANSTDRGISFGTNKKVSDDIPNVEHSISMDVDSQGLIYLMWQVTIAPVTTRNITFSKSTDFGNTFSPNKFIVSEDNYGSGPSMILDEDDNIYFVWHDKSGSSLDAFLSRSTDGGNTFSSKVRVHESYPASTQADPRIAVNSFGDIYVVWRDWRSGKADVYFSVSRDKGQTFKKSIRVNDLSVKSIYDPEIAVDSEGIPHVVWRDYRDDKYGDIYYSKGIPSLSYNWDFGDGSPHGNGIRPTHVYSNPGKYTVVLTVTDTEGKTDTDYCIVTILGDNEPPVADAGADQIVDVCDIVYFNGSGSYDPDGTIERYEWDFGDGSPIKVEVGPRHIYNTPGNYTATLAVTDNNNATDTDTCMITVFPSNQPPIADAGSDQTVNEGDTIQFDASASHDPDGAILSYHWDLGDGTEYTSSGIPSIFTQVTTNPNVDVDPRWNPQGDRIVFESTRSDYKRDLWTIYRDGASPQKLIGDYGWYERFPAWSPDGTKILYSRGLNDGSYQNYDLWVVNSDGTNPYAIRSTSMDERLGDWTPDGNKIVFIGLTSPGNYDVYIMDADGTNPIQLTHDPSWDNHARVSPDGTKITFNSKRTGSSEIWVMDIDGSNQHQITFDPGHENCYPDWNPDGSKIIFTKYDGSTSHLWMINLDGSSPVQQTTGNSYNDLADWHTNGNITFRSTRSGNMDIWILELGKDPDPTTTHTYGDDGVYIVTLRVTDTDNLTATDTCNVTVQNVDPTVTIESITMEVEIGLRVAGRKYNNVNMTLYENGSLLGYVSIERLPGSPDEQMAWIPVSINFSSSYNATITYNSKDPPNVGGNPVWIYLKSQNGSVNKIHHTFNVQQSKKRDSEHWNHIEPWEVDLNPHFIGLEFEITSHITDPGSDDELLSYTYSSQKVNVTYMNNPVHPDPYPSPEYNPRDIIDTTFLIFEGLGTVTLVVKDDDNIRLATGQGIDTINLG
jgi:Tol biopolymer transport system component